MLNRMNANNEIYKSLPGDVCVVDFVVVAVVGVSSVVVVVVGVGDLIVNR